MGLTLRNALLFDELQLARSHTRVLVRLALELPRITSLKVSPVPAQMRQDEPRLGAEVAGVSPVPAQMWRG